MYPISKAFQTLLGSNGKNRRVIWFGSMVTETGKTYEITTDIIGEGSGTLRSGLTIPCIGGAY